MIIKLSVDYEDKYKVRLLGGKFEKDGWYWYIDDEFDDVEKFMQWIPGYSEIHNLNNTMEI